MLIKRVLLIESGRFIGGVIHNLFSSNERLHVIESSPTNGRELLHAVQQHQPHTVVLDDTLKEDYLSQLLTYMQCSKDFRIVVVNTDHNQVEVYEKQRVPLQRSADLFAIL